MQGDYLSSLILAIYALRNQLTDEWPQYPGDEIKQIVEHSGLFLGDNAVEPDGFDRETASASAGNFSR